MLNIDIMKAKHRPKIMISPALK